MRSPRSPIPAGPWWAPLLAVAACDPIPDEITLRGEARESYAEGASPLVGAEVTIRDRRGEPYATTTTDDGGVFEVRAPAGEVVFAELIKEGFARASFTGVAGLQDVQRVEQGTVHGFSEAEGAAWEASFAGCPGVGASGGAVLGEARFLNLEVDGEHPLAITAIASVLERDGTEHPGCYLDEEGVAYAPDAEATGPSGRFAVYGVPPGVHTLVVGFAMSRGSRVVGAQIWQFEEYPVHIPEPGCEGSEPGCGPGVAPRFPIGLTWGL